MPRNRYLPAFLILAVLSAFLPANAVSEIPTGIYTLRFDTPPLARAGTGTGLDAMRSVANARKLDARRPASRAYLDALDRLHADRLAAVARRIGRRPPVIFRYRAVVNGLALRLTAAEAAQVRSLPGVRSVTADQLLPLDTDAGPAWIGAPALWDGSASATLPATHGEGVVVGVIDSGINMDHPSFSATPPDGHVYANPFGAGSFVGWCDPAHPDYDPAYVCNDKLVGAWDFVEAVSPEADGPEDGYFHGSHVASIAAGNALDRPAISGVAPHANVIAYDVCYTVSFGHEECPASAVTAAIDQAVLDGVDVINLSLGGGTDPWNDVDAALLDAVAAGVFVAASAGNDGPAPGTAGHLGPWVATVAASTHDRVVNENRLVSLSDGGALPPGDLTGRSLGPGYGPAPIVYTGGDCTNPFAAGTFPQAEIVVCDHLSLVRRFSYCENVALGGAGGCVLANVAGGPAYVIADLHAVPAVHVGQADGDALRAWLASGTGHQATLTASTLITDPAVADVLAFFSSRGPNPSFDVLKPDLTAPGWEILGAVSSGLLFGYTGDEYLTVSGTSMASPHVAGAAALLLALHPGWSPAEVRSALMTTAVTSLVKEDGVTAADPFDAGGGRPDLGRAARAGLVFPETAAAYAAADPALGGRPETLNVPSLVAGHCDLGCAFQRTVRTVLAAPAQWTATVSAPPGMTISVTPPAFSLDASSPLRTLDVTVTFGDGFSYGDWAFGEIVLVPDDVSVPATRLPVAILAIDASIFSDGFESGDTLAWSASVP